MHEIFQSKSKIKDFSGFEKMLNPKIENLFKFDIQKKRNYLKSLQNTAVEESAETGYETQKSSVFQSHLFQNLDDSKTQFRFWENNSTVFHQKFISLSFDRNLFLTFENETKFRNYLNPGNLLNFTEKSKVSFVNLIRDLKSLFANGKSDLFEISNLKLLVLKDSVEIEEYLFSQVVKVVSCHVADFERYFKLRQLRLEFSETINKDKFLNTNSVSVLLGAFEDFVGYALVKMGDCQTLLELRFFLRKLFAEIRTFAIFAENFKKGENSSRLIDAISDLRKSVSKSEALHHFLEFAYEVIFTPLVRIIQGVVFKNTEIDFLLRNLNIKFTRNADFNCASQNVPSVLKPLMDDLLNIKHNYMLLENSDKELYLRNLGVDFDLIHENKNSDVFDLCERVRVQFGVQKRGIDEIIELRFV